MKRFFILFCACLCFLSCSDGSVFLNERPSEKKVVSLVEWNLQTFFDGETSGSEYAEFTKSGNWNRDKYEVRLKRLCDFIANVNADFYVFEEIEHVGVIHDICNLLAGFSWDEGEKWMYSCFAKNEDSSIGCGVISKFPIVSVKTHEMDIRILKENQPSSRPLIQASFDVAGKNLEVFVVHWKSKSGGETETEIWRDWQESMCGYCLSSFLNESADVGNKAAVVCGDFNRSVEDFVCKVGSKSNENNSVFRFVDFGSGNFVSLFSPWLVNDTNLFDYGSYFYQDEWERIDNVFSVGNLRIIDFNPMDEGEWVNDDGTPFRYSLFSEKGYSDHLPLFCNLEL